MPSAIYYPHTGIRNPALIKTALLLWDDITCIVPRHPWRHQPLADKDLAEAAELITRYREPSLAEKQSAHEAVQSFLKDETARFLIASALHRWSPYGRPQGRDYRHSTWDPPINDMFLMYPDKFLPATWKLLEQENLALPDQATSDYSVPPVLGLLMMSSLADSCASAQYHKITDRVDAYSIIARTRAMLLGAPYVEGLDASQVAPDLQRLVTISLRVIDAQSIPLKKLIAMRKRESQSNSADYRKLRLRYFSALKSYVDRLLTDAKSIQDVKAIETEFEADMRDDLKSLKKELGFVSLESLFSEKMFLCVLALAGALAAPIAGLTTLATTLKGIGVVPLVLTAVKHRKERRKALLSHNMSWLYHATGKSITLR